MTISIDNGEAERCAHVTKQGDSSDNVSSFQAVEELPSIRIITDVITD